MDILHVSVATVETVEEAEAMTEAANLATAVATDILHVSVATVETVEEAEAMTVEMVNPGNPDIISKEDRATVGRKSRVMKEGGVKCVLKPELATSWRGSKPQSDSPETELAPLELEQQDQVVPHGAQACV
uniref:Band_3_cyto domain-containing protein n=1 Tax=Globodera pallida TaxID=36090 RepID=A0A183C3K0_GLOPA